MDNSVTDVVFQELDMTRTVDLFLGIDNPDTADVFLKMGNEIILTVWSN